MSLPRDPSPAPKAVKPGFTLVEMVVTLTVASILMVAVVGFLLNGLVSVAKT
jgi:prepilin-type N-terminal cleavage/methylation domain-containing protein